MSEFSSHYAIKVSKQVEGTLGLLSWQRKKSSETREQLKSIILMNA